MFKQDTVSRSMQEQMDTKTMTAKQISDVLTKTKIGQYPLHLSLTQMLHNAKLCHLQNPGKGNKNNMLKLDGLRVCSA